MICYGKKLKFNFLKQIKSMETIHEKKIIKTFLISDMEITKKTIFLLCFLTMTQFYAQVTYTFTNCSATGSVGPTQGMVNMAYSGTDLSGSVTVLGQGIQQWVVPTTGNYGIEAVGAQGFGPFGGRGARMYGEFTLTAGQVLKILVGQKGEPPISPGNNQYGGGGGSFVTDNTNAPLIVAGGGGGSWGSSFSANSDAPVTPNGRDGFDGPTNGVGGTSGNGGTDAGFGDGGGGLIGNGLGATGGLSFTNGGDGGVQYGHGGFGGGGGGSSYDNRRCGGGGGYSGGGGAGSTTTGFPEAGGGGSFNSGINQVNVGGDNLGHGVVLIKRLCDVEITPSKNPICLGESVTLSTNAVSNILWQNNGSSSATINESPTSTTQYTLIGGAASGCTTTVFLDVVVNPLPALTAVVIPSVLCIGKTATITASGASTYTWAGSGTISQTVTVNPNTTGSFAYSGTNQFACVNSSVVSVVVNTNVLSVSSNTSVCEGTSVNVFADGALTYTWSNGSYFATNIVTPASNTTYSVYATDIHNCEISGSVSVNVNPRPIVNATASETEICKDGEVILTASGASTYLWSTGLSASSLTLALPVDVVYHYTVVGTNANGCSNEANVSVKVNACTGINEIAASDLVALVYPNPASSVMIVQVNTTLPKTIEVTDVTGRIVLTATALSDKTELNIGELTSGIYYVRISSDNSLQTIKVVKN